MDEKMQRAQFANCLFQQSNNLTVDIFQLETTYIRSFVVQCEMTNNDMHPNKGKRYIVKTSGCL